MPSCAVRYCGSNHKNAKKLGIILHRFPTANKSMCKIWLTKCKTTNINVKNAVMCSKHFTDNQYDRDLQSELLNLPTKKRLLKTAIPTLHLTSLKDKKQNVDLREQRATKRSVRKRALWRIQTLSIENTEPNPTPQVPDTTQQVAAEQNSQENSQENTVIKLRQEIENLKTELKCAKDSLSTSKMQRTKLKKENSEKRKKSIEKIKSKLETCLKHHFTETQIRCILKNKTKAKTWPKEDIIEALTLRFLSKEAFQFIRRKKIPYPGLTTLSKWVKSFDCLPGILQSALTILKAQSYNNIEKQCVFVFGETSVDPRICYDQRSDAIYGPHKYVQFVTIRGLRKNWKQPIYYDFDRQMTKELLTKLIIEVENVGYQIRACVSTLGGKNIVWKSLGITPENSFFKNPHDQSRNVWVFVDVPNLIKILRNHFIDDGFILESGKIITKTVIQCLIDTEEAKFTHKLTEVHLKPTKSDRRKVKLATQLFSSSVAEGLVNFLTLKEESATFQLINDFFDVFNSTIQEDKNSPFKSGFGFNLEKQTAILNEMQNFIRNLRIIGENDILPFQTDFLISISSLKGLFNDLEKNSYILTRRLNQDCIQDLFDRIRNLGQFYDRPLPSEFKNRLSLILIGVNTECTDEPVNIISSSLVSNVTSNIGSNEILRESENLRNFLDDRETVLENTNNDICQVVIRGSDVTGLKYVAGYVAHRCCDIDKTLGNRNDKFKGNIPKWLCKSTCKFNLVEPSDEWYRLVNEFEVIFNQIHKSNISKEANVISCLQNTLKEKYPQLHKRIIKIYSRSRTLTRIKFLNNILTK